MLEKVCAYCEAQGLLPKGLHLLVACSGGPDSLALLDVLWRVRSKYALQIAAAHFEHGIRGEQSREDAAFVRDFCQERGIPFFLGAANVPQEMQERQESLEKVARDLRYAFLRRTMQQQGYTRLALAHHADDQAETVLMRLLRGTGTLGLGGMQPLTKDGRIRPFLCVTKKEILAYCQKRSLQPRHDVTNDLPEGTRNRLRLETLPRLKQQYNPELTRALCQLAEVARDEAAYFEEKADELWQDDSLVQKDQPIKLSQAAAKTLPVALQRVLLRRFWREVTGEGTDLGFVQAELLRELLLQGTTGSQQELPHHYVAHLAYGWLSCQKQVPKAAQTEQSLPLQLGSGSFGAYRISVQKIAAADMALPAATNCLYLPLDALEQKLCWRTRRPGDWLELPFGRCKLKKLMIDAKVPREQRTALPLLAKAEGSEIYWLPGIRCSSCLALDKRKGYPLYLQIIVAK